MIRKYAVLALVCLLPGIAGVLLGLALVIAPVSTMAGFGMLCLARIAIRWRWPRPPLQAQRRAHRPRLLLVALVALAGSAVGGLCLGLGIASHKAMSLDMATMAVLPAMLAWLVMAFAWARRHASRRKGRAGSVAV